MVFTAKGGRITLRRGPTPSHGAAAERRPVRGAAQPARRVPAGRGSRPAPVPGRRGGLPGLRHGAAHGAAAAHDARRPRVARRGVHVDATACWSSTTCATGCWSSPTPTSDKRDPAALDRAYDDAAVRIGMLLGKLGGRPAPPRRSALTAPVDRWWPWATRASPRPWTRRPFIGRRAPGQGVHRRRRCLPGRAVAPARLPSCAPIRSRSIARSAPSTRRPISSSCAWARRASSAPRRRCWCALEDDRVEERPIAGTHPRGRDRGGGRPAGRGDAARPQGAGRARHAGGPRAQRRGPGRRARLASR